MTGAGARRGLGCHLPTLPTDESADFSDPKRRGALPTSGEAYDPSRPWVADAPSTAALAAVLTEQFCGGSALSRRRRARSEFQAALSVLLPRSEQKDSRSDYQPSVVAASAVCSVQSASSSVVECLFAPPRERQQEDRARLCGQVQRRRPALEDHHPLRPPERRCRYEQIPFQPLGKLREPGQLRGPRSRLAPANRPEGPNRANHRGG
jgi:hypothetical protein